MPSERIYVRASAVAAACGMTEYVLDNHFRPDDWRSPRDFKLNEQSVLVYALDSVPALVFALKGNPVAPEAAEKLHYWYIEQLVATRAGLPALPAPVAPAPNVESAPPESWASRWEREHE